MAGAGGIAIGSVLGKLGEEVLELKKGGAATKTKANRRAKKKLYAKKLGIGKPVDPGANIYMKKGGKIKAAGTKAKRGVQG